MKKISKWLVYIAAASAVMFFASNAILKFDKIRPDVEAFLLKDNQVNDQVGGILKYELVKKISVTATDVSKPYYLYIFSVSGHKSKMKVIVRVEKIDDGRATYSIDRMEAA